MILLSTRRGELGYSRELNSRPASRSHAPIRREFVDQAVFVFVHCRCSHSHHGGAFEKAGLAAAKLRNHHHLSVARICVGCASSHIRQTSCLFPPTLFNSCYTPLALGLADKSSFGARDLRYGLKFVHSPGTADGS